MIQLNGEVAELRRKVFDLEESLSEKEQVWCGGAVVRRRRCGVVVKRRRRGGGSGEEEEGGAPVHQVLAARTAAVGLASASLAARGKDTLDQLEDTRTELARVQVSKYHS